ncbi:MAG: DNA topoisomerase IV subunit A [Parachlamydiaceae bacterium]
MEDVKLLMQHNYIKYASYVILDRAIPDVVDGLKPVQRRILFTLWLMHDGKLHKVANVAGQTMALHPHGDAPITEALVNMSNKGYLLDQQGNFGNIFTGDPAAASRYIETRLSPLAKETLFNPHITALLPSYDGRHQEPVSLPAKIPVVLMQGADGIAVGMATHIFPHNFLELLEAEIAILEGKPFNVLPDFPTGGIMDASQYAKGRGKVKLRAKIEVRDPKTLVIKEVCYGTTTESLIRSIDEAAKKGKIKIEGIQDYTAEHVEIEIKMSRGHYAQDVLDALYAYTECEVTLSSQIVVIKDNIPWEADVEEILQFHTGKLQDYLRQELEIEEERLKQKIFEKSLEQIFIENRLYKGIEEIDTYENIHQTISASLKPFCEELLREPNEEDRERLLNIPIRRISRFDLAKSQEEIAMCQTDLARVQKELKVMKKVTIRYLQNLIKKYAKEHPRRTEIQTIEQVNTRAMETKQIKVGFDPSSGFIGTKVESQHMLECTNFDKLLVVFTDGTYQIINIPEKQYMHHEANKVAYVGVADKKTVFSVAYRDPNTHYAYAKRFIIEKFIIDKCYRYLEEGMTLDYLSTEPNNTLELQLIPKHRQTVSKIQFQLESVLVKGVVAKGIKITPRQVKKIVPIKNLVLHSNGSS